MFAQQQGEVESTIKDDREEPEGGVREGRYRGYLAYKKPTPRMALQYEYA